MNWKLETFDHLQKFISVFKKIILVNVMCFLFLFSLFTVFQNVLLVIVYNYLIEVFYHFNYL